MGSPVVKIDAVDYFGIVEVDYNQPAFFAFYGGVVNDSGFFIDIVDTYNRVAGMNVQFFKIVY
jgi:hypothetical protein